MPSMRQVFITQKQANQISKSIFAKDDLKKSRRLLRKTTNDNLKKIANNGSSHGADQSVL